MTAVPKRNTALAHASTTVLYVAFALTGFATALLGATLPTMMVRWSLTDRGAGIVFLLLFFGTSIGALLSRGDAAYSTARGAALLFPACVAFAFVSGPFIFPIAFVYGLGLGIAITSINLLRSQRCAGNRIQEMNRLNVTWPLGAFACPWLANEVLHRYGVRALFLLLGTAFAAFTVWVLLAEIGVETPHPIRQVPASGRVPRLPIVIALAAMLATGLESSTGSWIATYSDRLKASFEAPAVAVSVFWFGLVASRALHSTKVIQHLTEQSLLRIATAIAGLGCILLLASHERTMLAFAGLLIGFGVGPVYPLLLAAALPRVSGNAIFVMAGLGGTIFPLLTGSLSTHSGSLRVGLIVPMVAGIAMLACAWRVSDALNAMERRRED